MPKTHRKKTAAGKGKIKALMGVPEEPPKEEPAESVQRPIPAPLLLRAEATRLEVLSYSMPDAAQQLISSQIWAYDLAAAYLESLGAPERLVRYLPAAENENNPA